MHNNPLPLLLVIHDLHAEKTKRQTVLVYAVLHSDDCCSWHLVGNSPFNSDGL